MDREVTKHDNQPPLEDRLALDHADLVKRATEAVALVPDDLRAIATDEEAADYTETAADLKAILKEADAAFTPEKEPWLKGGRTVETFFAFRATLKAKAAQVVKALDAFANAKLAAKRKAEAEAAEKARQEAAAFDEPVAPVAAPAPVKEIARVVTASGRMAAASTKWVHRVTDPTKVPRQYLMVNEAALKAAVDGGMRSIEGVEIFETARTSIR